MSALLCIKQLSWQVENQSILQGISFSLNKGEVLGIIGPNGAGKTSLLRCILQQQSGYRGEIRINNHAITSISNRELAKHFALVSQHTPDIFNYCVFDVVRMGLLPHKNLFERDNQNDLNIIKQALEKVGLQAAQQQQFNQLSGGEQQRALIARALVQNADIIVLDEPTNHLDVFYQHQILQLLNDLNLTVIMTVHDLNLAAQYCHRLLLLNKGEIVSDNTPEQVLTTDRLSEVFGLPCQVYYPKQEPENKPDKASNNRKIFFHLTNSDTPNYLKSHVSNITNRSGDNNA